MLSYHNDANLKDLIVQEMKNHQLNDQFIKGTYEEEIDGKFKGCAVGCAIDSFNIKLGKSYLNNDHEAFEEAIGVPQWLAYLQDRLFEKLPNEKSVQFAIDFLDSIPVGVNLNPVKWKFCAFILKDNIDRILNLGHISDEIQKRVVEVTQRALSLHEEIINTGDVAESAAISVKHAADDVFYAVLDIKNNTKWNVEIEVEANNACSALLNLADSASNAAIMACWKSFTRIYKTSLGTNVRDFVSCAAADGDESAAYQRYAKELLRLLINQQ